MSVRRALAWSFLGQFASFVLSFGGSVIVARLLNPRDMGIYAIAAASVGMINVVSTFGTGAYVVRATTLGTRTVDTAFTINAILALIVTATIMCAGAASTILFGEPAVGRILPWLGVGPLMGILEFRPSAMLMRDMELRTISVLSTAKGLVNVVFTIGAAYRGHSYMSMAYGSVASALAGPLLLTILARRHFSIRLSLLEWRPIATFGFRMMSISGVAIVTARLSDIILGRLLGVAALGLYSRASSVSNLLFENVYGAATRVVFVQLATDYRNKGTLSDSFLRGFDMIIAAMWPIIAGLSILAGPFFFIIYGEKWLGAALPLSLLMIAQFIVLSFGMNWELFVLRDETARQTKIELLRATIGTAIFTVGCSIGLAFAAVGRIAEAITGFLLYRSHVARLSSLRPVVLRAVLARGLMLAMAACAPSLFLMLGSGWSPRTAPALIALAIVFGIGLWLLTLKYLRHALYDEIARLVRRSMG